MTSREDQDRAIRQVIDEREFSVSEWTWFVVGTLCLVGVAWAAV